MISAQSHRPQTLMHDLYLHLVAYNKYKKKMLLSLKRTERHWQKLRRPQMSLIFLSSGWIGMIRVSSNILFSLFNLFLWTPALAPHPIKSCENNHMVSGYYSFTSSSHIQSIFCLFRASGSGQYLPFLNNTLHLSPGTL